MLLVLMTLILPTAHAGIFNVNTTVDLPDDGLAVTACHTSAGSCSLRAAIMKANQASGSSIIYVPAGTYTLTIPPSGSNGDNTGDLNITNSIAIIGQGAGRTIISAAEIDRVLDISSGQFVGLSGVTIRAGLKQGGDGAGIRNAGITTIDSCVIEDNYITTSGNNGAGIYSTGSLDITRSTIQENAIMGNGDGGGIHILGTAIIRESTISANSAKNGGGIFVKASSQYVYVVNSTISGNSAYNYGGGIFSADFNAGDVVGLYNASVIGNDASTDSGDAGQGGGVYANVGTGARFLIANTLIANNTINNRDAFDDCVGAVEAYGYNLFSLAVPLGCSVGGNGSDAWGQVSVQSLGLLQDNGGPTATHALLLNSEAINGTTAQGCIDQNGALLRFDQRGEPRVMGFRCDVGAYEYDPVLDRIFKNSFD